MTEQIDFTDALEECNRAFDELCQLRADEVAEAEGTFTFLSDDVITQFMESLADCAIMCRKQFIKLMMLQHLLEVEMKDKPDSIGIGSFRRTGE